MKLKKLCKLFRIKTFFSFHLKKYLYSIIILTSQDVKYQTFKKEINNDIGDLIEEIYLWEFQILMVI